MKVQLTNFQKIKSGSLEFPEGITVLTGLNGSGKSTVFYAIKNLMENPPGVTDCIRHHEKECRVTLENRGNKLTWVRTKNSSSYIDKNGELYVKASKLDATNFGDFGFYIDNRNRIISIHDQWCTLFPYGESNTDMFKLFEDIFNISCSVQILDEIRKDELVNKNKIDTLKQQIELDKCYIEKFEKLQIHFDINILDSLMKHIETSQKYLQKIQMDVSTYKNNLPYKNLKIPQPYDITELYHNKENLDRLNSDYVRYKINSGRRFWNIPSEIPVPNIIAPIKIKQDYEQYCITKALVVDYNNQIEDAKQKISELQDKINLIKVCPTCGRPF